MVPLDGFRFEYRPPIIRYGSGCVAELASELAAAGCERALVVCGTTVGETDAVIAPIQDGLGGRFVGLFAETTPEKRLGTAYRLSDRIEKRNVDVVIAVGGGSSLDIAKIATVLTATDQSRTTVGDTFETSRTVTVPNRPLLPVIAVPTTLAGADISQGAGITASPDSGLVGTETGGGVSHPKLMPHAVFADPRLVATTPRDVLAASAMNGFDKGIEGLYAANATAITDGTAVWGLSLLSDALVEFGKGDESEHRYEELLCGLLCVQYGLSRPDGSSLSLIHSFGHALARNTPLQQGTAHGVIAPHALSLLFSHVEGRRELLAEALGVAHTNDPAAAVIERVTEIRDALGLPARLRDLPGPDQDAFQSVAADVLADPLMRQAPNGFDPTPEEIETVLLNAW